MIRIDILSNGTLQLVGDDFTTYVSDESELKEPVRTSYALLSASDPGTHIEGIGKRISQRTFLIYEAGDDLTNDGVLMYVSIQLYWRASEAAKAKEMALRFNYIDYFEDL